MVLVAFDKLLPTDTPSSLDTTALSCSKWHALVTRPSTFWQRVLLQMPSLPPETERSRARRIAQETSDAALLNDHHSLSALCSLPSNTSKEHDTFHVCVEAEANLEKGRTGKQASKESVEQERVVLEQIAWSVSPRQKSFCLHTLRTWRARRSIRNTREDEEICKMLATAVVVVEPVAAAILLEVGFHSTSSPTTWSLLLPAQASEPGKKCAIARRTDSSVSQKTMPPPLSSSAKQPFKAAALAECESPVVLSEPRCATTCET
jgi:hypothetical protein